MNSKLKQLPGQKGQSLWEVIIALAITALVVIGLAKVTTTSLKGSRFSSDQTSAETLAQKKIANLINLKNNDFDTFWGMVVQGPATDTSNSGYCLLTQVSDVTFTDLPTTTPNYATAKMARISVDVFWEENGAGSDCDNKSFIHKLHFDTYASN